MSKKELGRLTMRLHLRTPIRSLALLELFIIAAPGTNVTFSAQSSAKADNRHTSFSSPTAELPTSGLEGGSRSALGPGGALYVTEAHAGRNLARGSSDWKDHDVCQRLTKRMPGSPFGGVVDVAFIGKTAYPLVTIVGPDVGGSHIVGIYRVDGRTRFTVVADIGDFSVRHPPTIPFPVQAPTGAQYALEPYPGGFLVTDGHLNRVLRVSLDGEITELIGFGNIVPTALALSGNKMHVAIAGPVPHQPEDGRVLSFRLRSPVPRQQASGARLMVDIEFGRGHTLYGLSQGVFPVGEPEGSPALPGTGALVKVQKNGTFKVVLKGLNQPTSLEFIGDTAFVVTYGGEIWRVDGVSSRALL